MKKFSALLQRDLFSFLLRPATYISCFIFFIASTIFYLYSTNFFDVSIGSSDFRFYFEFIPIIFIFVIPALTMNLWSNDELEILMPFKNSSLIISKWLSSVCVVIVSILISLALVFVVTQFGTIEKEIILSALIGLLFFISAVCAFSQLCSVAFQSSAASYFISAFFLALFTCNGYIAQSGIISSNFLVRTLQFFSFSWNFDAFTKGIIDTRNIGFFVSITALCIYSSCFIIENRKYGRSSKLHSKKMGAHIFVLVVLLSSLFIWNTQIFYKRFDITENNRFSLTQYTQELLTTLNANVTITYYVSDELKNIYPHIRDVEDFILGYANESHNVRVKIINPSENNIKQRLNDLGIIEQAIPITNQNTTTIVSVFSSIVLEYNNYTEFIPFVFDTTNLEFDIAGRIQSLTNTLNRTAFILVGNGLSLTNDYPLINPILENAGFLTKELRDDEILNVTLLDTNTPLILLGSSQLQSEHILAIKAFIQNGGKVFFSVSPVDIEIDTWESSIGPLSNYSIFNLLQEYGIDIETALLHDTNSLNTRLLSASGETHEIAYPMFLDVKINQSNKNNLLGSSFSGLSLLWASPIIHSQNKDSDIAFTSNSSWFQLRNDVLEEHGQAPFITNPFFDENTQARGETQTAYTIATSYDSNFVLVSDQYFLSRALSYIPQSDVVRNFDFLINALLWLNDDTELVKMKSKSQVDYSLNKISDTEEALKKQMLYLSLLTLWYVFTCSFPYCLLLFMRKKRLKK